MFVGFAFLAGRRFTALPSQDDINALNEAVRTGSNPALLPSPRGSAEKEAIADGLGLAELGVTNLKDEDVCDDADTVDSDDSTAAVTGVDGPQPTLLPVQPYRSSHSLSSHSVTAQEAAVDHVLATQTPAVRHKVRVEASCCLLSLARGMTLIAFVSWGVDVVFQELKPLAPVS